MRRHLIWTLFLTSFLAGGAWAQGTPAGSEWKLTFLRGLSVGDSAVTISIDQDGRRFSGNTSCNLMKGTVDLSREAIKFNPTITTKASCTVSTAKIESGVLSALGRADRYRIENYKLRLFAG